MGRPLRIFAVTLGLAVTGAVFGALAGVVAFALGLLISQGFLRPGDLDALPFAGGFGAIIGAIAAPAAGWLLLRRVPLGRAVAWSVLGAVTGAVAGWVLGGGFDAGTNGVRSFGDPFVNAVAGALLGFLIAAVVLRRRAGRDARAIKADSTLD